MDNQNKTSQESESQNSDSRHPELGSGFQEIKQSFKLPVRKLYLLFALIILLSFLTLINIFLSPFIQESRTQQVATQPFLTINTATSPVPNGIGANWKTYTSKFGLIRIEITNLYML